MYNWKLGLSIGDLSKKMFDDCAKNGVDVVEVSVGDNVLRELDWNSVKQNAKDSGVGIWSVHLPFWGNPKIDPADMDKSVRDYTVEHFRDLIGRSAELGAKIAVVHPALEPTKPEERATRVGYSQESMAKLAEIAAGYGMTAAVEDLPRTCLGNTAAELLEIVSADDRLGVTFDVNHLLEDTHENFMKLLGKRIVTLHISDYDFQNERHRIPGEGGIDWKSLMAMLKDAGYTGPWLYELSMQTPDSITRPRGLTVADVRANYDVLMSGNVPAPFGTVNKDVCDANAYVRR